MAKGNNGNLLQHGIEVELGCTLAGDEAPLSIFFTHAMGPFERCDKSKTKSGTKLLGRWLDWPYTIEGHPAVALAYRRLKASTQHYPNSAELLAAVLGRTRLRGHLFDTEPNVINKLKRRWSGTQVQVHHHSWRTGLSRFNDLPSGPWLMSLDPYTFLLGPDDEDDGYLREVDLRRFEAATRFRLRIPEVPGVVLVFCYHLSLEQLGSFKNSLLSVFGSAEGVRVTFIEASPIGLHRHACAVVTNTPMLATLAQETWERLVEEGSK